MEDPVLGWYTLISIIIGVIAWLGCRRNGVTWFCISFMFTPPIAAIVLFCMGINKEPRK